MGVLRDIGEAIATGAGLFWRAFWALALGYAISAAIQVFVSRSQTARHLGRARVREVGLGMGLGFISSSCSFAALSATRALFAKGAHVVPALAFMFASTNLAIEVAILTWIFLGWQFVLALFVGAFALVAAMWLFVRLTARERRVEQARRRASDVEADDMRHDEPLRGSLVERVRNPAAWQRIGTAFRAEWAMVWKELLVGFTVAGAVAALVPRSFFEALFPDGLAPALLVAVHVLLAPVLAVLTFIGSMGNGPLAAVLWQNGVAFGAIMAFLYADFIVPPSLKINARYYGWRFAAYLGLVFAAAAVVAGLAIHGVFALLGLIPETRKDIRELATFAFDYTFVLNVVALGVSAALVWASRRGKERGDEHRGAAVERA